MNEYDWEYEYDVCWYTVMQVSLQQIKTSPNKYLFKGVYIIPTRLSMLNLDELTYLIKDKIDDNILFVRYCDTKNLEKKLDVNSFLTMIKLIHDVDYNDIKIRLTCDAENYIKHQRVSKLNEIFKK